MAPERIPMTRDGYDKLKADLDRMQNTEMLEVAKRIAAARALGDLSENAEYHAAREDQGILQAQINDKKDQLARAQIIDRSKLPTDAVAFGAHVKVKDLDVDEAWPTSWTATICPTARLSSAPKCGSRTSIWQRKKSSCSSGPAKKITTTTKSSPPAPLAKACWARSRATWWRFKFPWENYASRLWRSRCREPTTLEQ